MNIVATVLIVYQLIMTHLARMMCSMRTFRPQTHPNIINKTRSISFSHEFTQSDEAYILEKINKSTLEDLGRFSISKNRSKNIVTYRNKHGQFHSLDQMLDVDGFGIKNLLMLCKSIIHKEEIKDLPLPVTRKSHSFIVPHLSTQRLQELSSVVGVSLGAFSVSWTAVQISQKLVYDWKTIDFNLDPKVKKNSEAELLEVAHSLQRKLPPADLYVLDGKTMIKSDQKQSVNTMANLQTIQLAAMMTVLLNMPGPAADSDETWKHKVVFQSGTLWCRLFGTLVGKEKVSPQNFVHKILQGTHEGNFFTPLVIGPSLKAKYMAAKPVEREALCRALLLTIAFLDLNLFKNPDSLRIVSGKNRTKK